MAVLPKRPGRAFHLHGPGALGTPRGSFVYLPETTTVVDGLTGKYGGETLEYLVFFRLLPTFGLKPILEFLRKKGFHP